MSRPAIEVADLLRLLHQQCRLPTLSPAQAKVVRALIACRTAALGGHVDACTACGHQVISYNSCRNRHCPKCQGSATAEWLESQRKTLLPVPYAHVVFTLPALLAPLALQNPRVVYGMLFQAVSASLLRVAATPRHLGARLGFLAILHTWGQNLLHHPHLHCVIPTGGLAPDPSRWIPCRSGFFLPVRVLSRLFRGRFLALLREAYGAGSLHFYGELDVLKHPDAFRTLLKQVQTRDWVVYAKPPFGGPECVLKYLARYTHRIAISNHRLSEVREDQVTFTWKDYRLGHQQRLMTLTIQEFVRRFLLHVLPARFVKIRYYGFLAQSQRNNALPLCRQLLAQTAAATPARLDSTEPSDPASPPHSFSCPNCRGTDLIRLRTLSPFDSS
ncbi:MAG: IS91 family transposase [Longimicrobiales bacterium]